METCLNKPQMKHTRENHDGIFPETFLESCTSMFSKTCHSSSSSNHPFESSMPTSHGFFHCLASLLSANIDSDPEAFVLATPVLLIEHDVLIAAK